MICKPGPNAAPSPRPSDPRGTALPAKRHLLSSPGAILARCARRHDIPQVKLEHRRELFQLLWFKLRTYFGNRVFARLILSNSQHTRYPEALAEAALKGGLESVLDEQMSVLRAIGEKDGRDLLLEMAGSLLDRPGAVRLRRGRRDERARVKRPFHSRAANSEPLKEAEGCDPTHCDELSTRLSGHTSYLRLPLARKVWTSTSGAIASSIGIYLPIPWTSSSGRAVSLVTRL